MRPGFIISVLLLCYKVLSGQSLPGDSLLAYEQLIYKSQSDSAKEELVLKKVNLYLRYGITRKEVLSEMRRIRVDHLQKEERSQNFLWNGALVAYLNEETDYARFLLAAYQHRRLDTTLESRLLAVLIYKDLDTVFVNTQINILGSADSIFLGLHCFTSVQNYRRRHLNFYLIASAVLPGSGTALNGYVTKGLVSLAINAASVYGIVKLVQYGLYVNAILWGTGVGLKFYTGNLRLTHRLFYNDEADKKSELTQQCELTLKNILISYPLNLKY